MAGWSGPGERLCPHFQKCLDCPFLLIPRDKEHLALLLQAKEAFESARERLPRERWEFFYASSYQTLISGILPLMPKVLESEVREMIAALPPLPELE